MWYLLWYRVQLNCRVVSVPKPDYLLCNELGG